MKTMMLITLMLIFPVLGMAQAKELKPQTVCPVMGEKINKKFFVDFQGQRIYFCCDNCIAKFQADPEKYMEKFEKDGILLENVQKKDPVCGMDITDKSIKRDYKARRIYFCSDYCAKEFDKNPKAALEKMSK